MRTFSRYIVIIISFLTILSCNKKEGEGGTASLYGKVLVTEKDEFSGQEIKQYYALEKRVYIIYGDDNTFNDNTRTDFEGKFTFSYLKKGNYEIYTISDCDTCAGGEKAVFIYAKISNRSQDLNVGNLYIEKTVD